jgi:branched-chain amino acid transport system ATP-binding protein
MLTIDEVHTYYGDSHVLQGVSMRIEKGSVTTLLGRNGVGKTTLCRSLTGLTPARRGRIELEGRDIRRLPAHRIWQAGLAIVPQGRHIFPSLTVQENLAIAARMPVGRRWSVSPSADSTSSAPREWTVSRVLEAFPRLGERLQNRGNELSGGEQQMLAIARALVSNPSLLVMDEPTEGLSPTMVAEVGRIIARVKQAGTTVLLVEQNAAFALKAADVAYVMSKGRIVHSAAAAALWADEAIKATYLGVPVSSMNDER